MSSNNDKTRVCFCCGKKETRKRKLTLFQGYVEDSLEYVEEYVCSVCYLTHKDDIALLITLTKRKIERIEQEIKEIETIGKQYGLNRSKGSKASGHPQRTQ